MQPPNEPKKINAGAIELFRSPNGELLLVQTAVAAIPVDQIGGLLVELACAGAAQVAATQGAAESQAWTLELTKQIAAQVASRGVPTIIRPVNS